MGATELNQYLQTTPTAPLLIDVREPWEHERCLIENSMLIPMNTIPQRMTDLDRDRETVVICHHGIRSRSVAHYLVHNNFSQVINLSGGIDAWAKEVDSSMATY